MVITMLNRHRWRGRGPCLVLVLAATSYLAACDASDPFGGDDPSRDIRLMTRNVYLGADIFSIVDAQTSAEVVAKVTAAWAAVVASDFPERAKVLAAEIAAADPHLVGLQEVSLYRLQSPGDLPGLVPATDTVYDFLAILQQELSALGLAYDVVVESRNADVEMPLANQSGGLDDIRMTDRDVILVKSEVDWTDPQHARFTERYLVLVAGALPVPFFRSWTSVVATIGGRTIRFVNAHLETQVDPTVQEAQAQELIGLLQGETRPVALVGDFNSPADNSGTVSYQRFGQASWEDSWTTSGGFTCCHAADLRNDTVDLDERIDIIFRSPADFDVVDIQVVGDELADRTPAGLWPSDHAGVVATLRLR